MAQVVQHLPGKHEALSSNTCISKKKKSNSHSDDQIKAYYEKYDGTSLGFPKQA
jgi:hypothetical protein